MWYIEICDHSSCVCVHFLRHRQRCMVLVLNESHYILLAEHGVSGKSDHSVDPAAYAGFSLGALSSVRDYFTWDWHWTGFCVYITTMRCAISLVKQRIITSVGLGTWSLTRSWFNAELRSRVSQPTTKMRIYFVVPNCQKVATICS
jgi:hypothetical protein